MNGEYDEKTNDFIFVEENVQIFNKDNKISDLSRSCRASTDFSNLKTNLDGVGFSSENCLCRLYSSSYEIEENPSSFSAELLEALKKGYEKTKTETGGKKLFFMGMVPRYHMIVISIDIERKFIITY